MDVAAVVLSWNGRDNTLKCLRSLDNVTYRSFHVIVVDNGSTDGSADSISVSRPGLELVRLNENTGFAKGMNTGIRHAFAAGAEGVVTLNNDMVVDPAFVEPLADALVSDPRAGAACSQILFADPPDRVWYAGAPYDPRRGYQGRHTRYGEPPMPLDATPYVTDRACAGAMLIPRGVAERVGLFDEELFAYAEDVDWSLRARRVGKHVLVVPGSIVRHRVSAASGGESSPMSLYYNLRNGLTVAERHAPLGALATARRRAEAVAAHGVQGLLSARRREGLVAVRDGWRDFRAGRLGERVT